MNTARFKADPKGAMEAVYKDWVKELRQRQGPAHVLQAGGLRQVRRLAATRAAAACTSC